MVVRDSAGNLVDGDCGKVQVDSALITEAWIVELG